MDATKFLKARFYDVLLFLSLGFFATTSYLSITKNGEFNPVDLANVEVVRYGMFNVLSNNTEYFVPFSEFDNDSSSYLSCLAEYCVILNSKLTSFDAFYIDKNESDSLGVLSIYFCTSANLDTEQKAQSILEALTNYSFEEKVEILADHLNHLVAYNYIKFLEEKYNENNFNSGLYFSNF